MIKEQQPQKRYIKIIDGNDETDFSTFFKAIHHGIVGLFENFNKQKFLLLIQMLYENLKSIEIYNRLKILILWEIQKFKLIPKQ